jgi:hypothetical protein
MAPKMLDRTKIASGTETAETLKKRVRLHQLPDATVETIKAFRDEGHSLRTIAARSGPVLSEDLAGRLVF